MHAEKDAAERIQTDSFGLHEFCSCLEGALSARNSDPFATRLTVARRMTVPRWATGGGSRVAPRKGWAQPQNPLVAWDKASTGSAFGKGCKATCEGRTKTRRGPEGPLRAFALRWLTLSCSGPAAYHQCAREGDQPQPLVLVVALCTQRGH